MVAYDYCVIGGGIVGLATAKALQEAEPGAKIIVLEKESGLARHQTGHNSGVIHAGIYYQPGSLKARLCRAGAEATKAFCKQYAIPFETCGKLLVATSVPEVKRMEALAARAVQNDIAFHHYDRQALRNAEPAISGLGALFVPATGIVDYAQICKAMAAEIIERGGQVRLNSEVTTICEEEKDVLISVGGATLRATKLVACAGLQSDRIARLARLEISHRIVPFRGEYYTLPQSKANIVKHLIYPIPDPDLPFLGIHLTRTIQGGVTVGPNAVLGFSREGYPKGSFRATDVADMSLFPGFWKMALKNWRSAVSEFGNSASRARYLRECRKYCPELELSDLGMPGAGIRAQAVLNDGTLVHDFLFKETARTLHVCNAPSPAATSSIPIGRMIAEKLLRGVSGE
ncbi:L-2-hydroxyglutarate oxidase [Ochrobactrum sp. CM-21-5]|nr:L-2-hydroxyglutarate oxidase [Ochrobactrum sp. CM-21-5]MBC2886258.1 L-2-hydroxyglutarate oxidase [Ochrobactrum sp. CM-21-5]